MKRPWSPSRATFKEVIAVVKTNDNEPWEKAVRRDEIEWVWGTVWCWKDEERVIGLIVTRFQV